MYRAGQRETPPAFAGRSQAMGERRRSAQVLEESSEGLPALALFETIAAQLELLFQKPGDRFHPSLPCRQRLHVNVAIVGVATEVMTAAFQFLVEIIQQQIG